MWIKIISSSQHITLINLDQAIAIWIDKDEIYFSLQGNYYLMKCPYEKELWGKIINYLAIK
jgi:hypothetical protein